MGHVEVRNLDFSILAKKGKDKSFVFSHRKRLLSFHCE